MSRLSTAPLRANAYMDWLALDSLFSEELGSISGEEVVVAGGVLLFRMLCCRDAAEVVVDAEP